MPTRKIDDVPDSQRYCRDFDHNPPSHMVYENGTYEHECPTCGKKTRFVVNNPTL